MVIGKEAIDARSYKVYSLEMTEVSANPDEIAWRERKWEERDAIVDTSRGNKPQTTEYRGEDVSVCFLTNKSIAVF